MRLIYLSEAIIPSRSTNSMQTMRMCAALAGAGAEVTLVHPRHHGPDPEGYAGSLGAFYGVAENFERHALPTPPARLTNGSKRVSRVSRLVPFGAYLAGRSCPGRGEFACYGRSLVASWAAMRARRLWGRRAACRGLAVEVHDEPPTASSWRLLSSVEGVFAISEALRARLVAESPVIADRAWVEHDGVDLSLVSPQLLDRQAARARLGLEHTRELLVVYTGRAIAGKGVDVLLEAAPRLQAAGARVIVVGKVYDPGYVARAPANVAFTGFLPPADVPDYLAAADVLVMPTTEDLPYSAYTSPLKLFEYMASGRPVVASDLPVLREVLEDGKNALTYAPRDADGLAAAVERLADDRALAGALADQAWRDVQEYAWDRRARRILDRLSTLTGLA